MVGIGRSKPFGVALVFAGTLAVITYLTGSVLPQTLPSADGSSTQGSQMTDALIVQEKQIPLDCRIGRIGDAERRRAMEKSEWFRSRLDRVKSRGRPGAAAHMFCNPLIANMYWFKVEVENTSGGDFTFLTYDDCSFLVETSVQDSAGKPLVYDTAFLSATSRGRWAPPQMFSDCYPLKTMKAGQVETFSPSFFRSGPDYCHIKPGKYSMRATYLYWTPDGTERRVESQPFPVTVTAEDIKEWKEFWE
jgi:hypothetical protein